MGKARPGFNWHQGCVLAASTLVFLALPVFPQQAPSTPPEPDSKQHPGSGEQVHTGTTSGIDADARIQNLLADHQFTRIESQLDQLPPEQAQFYRGILANRNNDLKDSIQLLEPLVERVAASGDKAHEKLLRMTLAEDYLRAGDLAKAAAAYQALETRLDSSLSADEKDEIELPLKLLPLAAANPAMTVEPCDSFSLMVVKNPLGLIDVPVFVDARSHSWMLDPTSPVNLISRSLAKGAGLKVSEQAATIHALTGRPIQVHATVIPRFTLGGRLTLRNVTAFVFEDADYSFAQSNYQVEGVLGYPALSGVSSLTVTADDTIEITPIEPIGENAKDKKPAEPTGARMYFDGDQMIVALGKPGEERVYAVDAGGQQTYLTSRYFDEHAADFAGKKMELYTLPGPQSRAPEPTYTAETVSFVVGSEIVHPHYIQVLTQPLGSAALDDVYGVLGLDVLDQLRAYTFDYRNMRFSVRPE